MSKPKKFVPLTRKISRLIIVSMVLGIGVITTFFSGYLFFTFENSNERNLLQQSRMMYTAIENFMLPGEAPLAVNFFDDMEELQEDFEVFLYRTDGTEAFTDTDTIQEVNNNIRQAQDNNSNILLQYRTRNIETFELPSRQDIMSVMIGTEEDETDEAEQRFQQAISMPPDDQIFQDTINGITYLRIFKPLINKPVCAQCHGSDHTIRGVIDIHSDISSVIRNQRFAIAVSGSLFLFMVILLSLALTRLLQGNVVRPVQRIGAVCTAVTSGDFEQRVNVNNNDEIGELGKTVNTMVEGLYERFELSKFVSSGTLKSLSGDKQGKRVPLTMLFSDIRGFTSYSENRTSEEVVSNLNKLLNFQSQIIHEVGGDIDKFVGDEIVAIFTGEESAVQASTAAVRIQKTLNQANKNEYDGLQVGIGIKYGEVILGMIGSEDRADYTVIGDTVNTASRFCSAAKAGQIIISDDLWSLVKDDFSADGPYRLKVKGKSDYQRVYLLQSDKEHS
ncbi:MAG: adenylate/guanylate cyclase domain-containing protein [Spirochaetia bacterium]